jgi:hypothetical protein
MFINYDAIQLAPSYDGSGFQSSTSTKSDSTPIISCPREYSFLYGKYYVFKWPAGSLEETQFYKASAQ